jgi:hypothetical protein
MYSEEIFKNLLMKYKNNYEEENNKLIELKNNLKEIEIEMELFSTPFKYFDLEEIKNIKLQKDNESKILEEKIEKQTKQVEIQKSMFNRLLELYKFSFGKQPNFKSID